MSNDLVLIRLKYHEKTYLYCSDCCIFSLYCSQLFFNVVNFCASCVFPHTHYVYIILILPQHFSLTQVLQRSLLKDQPFVFSLPCTCFCFCFFKCWQMSCSVDIFVPLIVFICWRCYWFVYNSIRSSQYSSI